MQDYLTLQPIARVNGTINLPGSKSISNRALLLSALSTGKTRLINLLNSDDVKHMLNALKLLGVNFSLHKHGTICEIIGTKGLLFPQKNQKLTELFLGNAGTAMRSLCAVLSLINYPVILTGDNRMKERPIGYLVDALRQGGANINYLKEVGYPPLKMHGGFIGGELTMMGNISSQFLTALLIAAPLAPQDTIITIIGSLVSKPYIDTTLHLMKSFKVNVDNQNYHRFIIKGHQEYHSPGDYLVEGDASSASYFLAASAIKGGTVCVKGVGCNSVQGDIKFAHVLENMGAKIEWGEHYIACTRHKLYAVEMDMNHIPDAAMTIATTALFAKGTTLISNIYNWRVKETDRLNAMSIELRKIGAIVEEGEDFIRITPPDYFKATNITTYNDHRMAMCFSLIALSNVSITICNPNCVTKTFPDYFQLFQKICQID